MNKILIRICIFFIVIVIVLFLLILLRSRSPFGRDNSSFASEPKEEITKIEFSENGKKLTLEKKGEAWLVNGKSEARKSGILFILRILKEIKIKSPVSQDLYNTEISGENISPVKVKVFEKHRLLKTIFVYKTTSNNYGNIMKIKETSKPFIVYVPGYDGDIGSGFTLNELFWQPFIVFNLLPSEIASVNLENLSDTASSFSICNKNHHFFLCGPSGKLTGWDSALVTRYISYFVYVPFESWAFKLDESEKKSIEAQKPLYKLTVITSGGKKVVLTLWLMHSDKESYDKINSDRLLGKTDEKDELFIMRYFDIDPLIKKRSYFYQQ